VTGDETVVFSCFNQDQPLDLVDWGNLRTRLSQMGVQEKLTKAVDRRCLREMGRGVGFPNEAIWLAGRGK